MTGKEFDTLALDGHNYPTWAMDVKVSLASRGILAAIQAPHEEAGPLQDQIKYSALYLIRNHIHPDLKSEYLMEENPYALWEALKSRYEQQKAVILPEANHEWTHLRLQDFKSIGDFNHAVHKICSKLRFCEKEPSDADKIEKTLSTMFPADRVLQQQYRARNYQNYTDLIHVLLQAEKHDELLLRNHHQRPVGSAPLPEVHHNDQHSKKFNGSKNHPKNFQGKSNQKRNKKRNFRASDQGKGNFKPKFDKSKACQKCGCYNHITKKCRTPRHLINLYLQSVGRKQPTQGSKFEAHFNLQTDTTKEASCSQDVPKEPSNNKTPLQSEDPFNKDDMIIEYASNDMFGDLN